MAVIGGYKRAEGQMLWFAERMTKQSESPLKLINPELFVYFSVTHVYHFAHEIKSVQLSWEAISEAVRQNKTIGFMLWAFSYRNIAAKQFNRWACVRVCVCVYVCVCVVIVTDHVILTVRSWIGSRSECREHNIDLVLRTCPEWFLPNSRHY